jgi:isoquinoline 1-oxidoreductase
MSKDDGYIGLDFSDIEVLPPFTLTRRDFLKLLEAGIFVFFFFDVSKAHGDNGDQQDQMRGIGFRQQEPADFNAFLRIGEEGSVTCFTGKIEMGQGIITSLGQMLAEELDVDPASVQMVMGDTDLCPWDMGTFGSLSTRFFGPTLRAAAAEARGVLLELGAKALKKSKNRLDTENGFVFDKADPKNRVSYASLARGKKIDKHLKKKPPLKPASDFKVIGESLPRRDALEKVTGRALYAADIRLPGMLYAKILRPPAYGAKLAEVDLSEVERMKDVLTIRDGELTAVLHSTPDGAEGALKKIRSRFDSKVSGADDKSIFEHLLNVAPKGQMLTNGGNVEEGKKLAAEVFEQTYLNSYVAHACIETHSAIAQIKGGKVTVWVSTQIPFMTRDAVARALDLPPENVRIITPYVGGGFGGKSQSEQAVEAARLAKMIGRPVQVAWSREEEFFFDAFRPAAVVKIDSGIQNTGKIVYWDYKVYYAGDRGASHFYEIPHHRTVSTGFSHRQGWRAPPGSHPFKVGPWRAPSANTNTFARESQIDIMAAAAGTDPLAFRLKHLKDKKMVRVLKAAAEKFGWVSEKAPSGRGCGLACAIDAGSYVAHMAEVEVDKNGHVQVKRVVCAQDMGLVVNPEGAKMQIEGSVIMGLGYALTEEVHFEGGKILDLNFDTYKIPRFSWLPQIYAILIDDMDSPPQGCGEPAIVCMGAVIANAIYDAMGARLYQLPMTTDRIREAMKKGTDSIAAVKRLR